MATMILGSKADVFQLHGQTWICKNELESDVTIEIGEMSFQLHKFPLLNKSGLLQKMISEFHSEDGKGCVLKLHEIPGGAKAFELVAKFCYDVKFTLNPHNVVHLRCVAEYLKMTEDYVGGNLIFQTENFLNEVLSNWMDSVKALEASEEVLPFAEDLHIVSRCISSMATKACSDPSTVGRTYTNSPEGGSGIVWNGILSGEMTSSIGEDWWYEDVSLLSLSQYKRLILTMESKDMKPENIVGSLTFYAKKYLPGLSKNSSSCNGTSAPVLSESDQKALLEQIVELLPMKKGITPTKFLLNLLRTAMILHSSPSCCDNLEKRVGLQLDDACLEDILIPNLGHSSETLHDTDCVQRIIDHFLIAEQPVAEISVGILDEGQLMGAEPSSFAPMTMVAKLIDGYLAEIAPDVNLKFPKFQALASIIPDYARSLDDGIYRAIDIYLKSHPWLTDSEREQLCRLMNCQKLSLEACTHAAQNERLPLRVIVQVLFFEQLRLRTSIASWFFVSDNMGAAAAGGGGGYHGLLESDVARGGPEDIKLRVSELEKECVVMKDEIERIQKPKSSWSLFSRKLGFGFRSQRR